LVGGRFIDKLGVRAATVLLGALVLLGSMMFWLAIRLVDIDAELRFGLMLCAMIVFGTGAESLTVAMKAMLATWFADADEFPGPGFAFGNVTSLAQSASACDA